MLPRAPGNREAMDEYQGEEIAILNGARYGIYRTYSPNGEEMELYLEQKAGV